MNASKFKAEHDMKLIVLCSTPFLMFSDYIEEAEPLVNKYISVPTDYGHFNCAAFSAGIINGVLDAAGFPAEVTAKVLARNGDDDPQQQQGQPLTIYYIKFQPQVLEREKRLSIRS